MCNKLGKGINVEKLFRNKNVLVTGGAGSVGQALTQEILKYRPKAVRIFDIDETRQFEFQQELRKIKNVRFFIGDVRDKTRLRYAAESVDIIFHAAALKHVEACEYNPFEAIKTNVLGTQNVIDVSIEEEVSKVIFTSSDKAVNPTNVMGTTKLMCERLMTAANYYRGARKLVFSSVRFGNVIGSRGSVTPLFRDQIRAGGPITVTNPNMTRFVMSMQRALELLFEATQMAQGGEVFIFKIQAVKVLDLAKATIEIIAPKFGYRPSEIKMEVVGSKPGEKMYEELMTVDEANRALETKDMFIILPEMRKLLDVELRYPGANPVKLKSYKSSDSRLLTNVGIKKLLHEGHLLEA